VIFRVPINALSQASEQFQGDFANHGATDDNPMILEGYESGDFESLLKVIFPKCVCDTFSLQQNAR
jgi:hypothetical protein